MVVELVMKLEFDEDVDLDALASNVEYIIRVVLPGEHPYAYPVDVDVRVVSAGG